MRKTTIAIAILALCIVPLKFALAQVDGDCLSPEYVEGPFDGYTKYEGQIYYGYCPVKGADSKTFRKIPEIGDTHRALAVDSKSVFQAGELLEGVSPNSYKTMAVKYADETDGGKVKDLFFVYGNGNTYLYSMRVDGLDLETVKVINPEYFKDKSHVYGIGEKSVIRIPDADPAFFTFGYMATSDAVYWYGKRIPEADAGSFEIGINYDNELARDKNNAYNKGKIIYGADPKSFQVFRIEIDKNSALYARIDKDNYFNPKTITYEKPLSLLEKDYPQESAKIDQSIQSAIQTYETKYPGYEPKPAQPPAGSPEAAELAKMEEATRGEQTWQIALWGGSAFGGLLALGGGVWAWRRRKAGK